MDKFHSEFIKNRPQRLCKMCGKCCRVTTSAYSYNEIKMYAEQGNEEAIYFLENFEVYPSIEEAKKADKKTVDSIIEQLTATGATNKENLTFYKCKHLQDDNLCKIYLNRPYLCANFPSSPWTIIPQGCGFEGWLFQKREEIKKEIRHKKEKLLSLEIALKEAQDNDKEDIILSIESIKKNISKFERYGSKEW